MAETNAKVKPNVDATLKSYQFRWGQVHAVRANSFDVKAWVSYYIIIMYSLYFEHFLYFEIIINTRIS